MVSVIKLSTRDAVGDALDQIAQHWREGHLTGLSLHVEPNGTARLSVVYAEGADTSLIPLAGVATEDDE